MLEAFELPIWILVIVTSATIALKGVQYFRDLASSGGSPGGSVDEAADRREILTLVRQSHQLQERHVQELGLLREILQQHHRASQKAVDQIDELHSRLQTRHD